MKRIQFSERSVHLGVWLLLAGIAIAITCALQGFATQSVSLRFWSGEEWLRDRIVRLQAKNQAETRLSLIDIDDSSMAELGPMPWPRERIAEMIEILLSDYQVKGIALDIVFEEAKDALGDERLKQLATHAPVVFAQSFDFIHGRELALQNGQLIQMRPFSTLNRDLGFANAQASGYIANHAGLQAARCAGNIGFLPDPDGSLRRIPFLTYYQGKSYPSLSLALLQCADKSAPSVATLGGNLLIDDHGFQRLAFTRDYNSYDVIPASMVLKQELQAEKLRGRYVIIGSSGFSLADRVPTPLFNSTNGFLVHAQALGQLLDIQQGQRLVRWNGSLISISFIILMSALSIVALPRFAAWINVSLLLSAALSWFGMSFVINPHDGDYLSVAPLWSLIFLLLIGVPCAWQLSQSRSRRLLGALQQYVARAVVDELLRSDLQDPLAPRQSHVTTLIADMQGYTSQVESMSMEEAATLTREFLACLTDPVLNSGGTLDKYTGDGLVAFWGAPLPVEQHADLALDAAIQMLKRVDALSQRYAMEGKAKIRVRIGIESGLAMAGDFGSERRSIYTAVGDSVNTASRLEQVARDFPHDIIVGPGTVGYARRHQFILLGERLLKGKEKPTRLYTVEFS